MTYLRLVMLLCWLGSVASAGWWGYGQGRQSAQAQTALEDMVATRAADAAATAAADAVSRIKVQHSTVINEVRHEIDAHPVYRDCEHPAGQLQRINAAITGQQLAPAAGGAGDGVRPMPHGPGPAAAAPAVAPAAAQAGKPAPATPLPSIYTGG